MVNTSLSAAYLRLTGINIQESRTVEVRQLYSVPPPRALELITSCSSEGVQIGGVCSAAGVVGLDLTHTTNKVVSIFHPHQHRGLTCLAIR